MRMSGADNKEARILTIGSLALNEFFMQGVALAPKTSESQDFMEPRKQVV